MPSWAASMAGSSLARGAEAGLSPTFGLQENELRRPALALFESGTQVGGSDVYELTLGILVRLLAGRVFVNVGPGRLPADGKLPCNCGDIAAVRGDGAQDFRNALIVGALEIRIPRYFKPDGMGRQAGNEGYRRRGRPFPVGATIRSSLFL